VIVSLLSVGKTGLAILLRTIIAVFAFGAFGSILRHSYKPIDTTNKIVSKQQKKVSQKYKLTYPKIIKMRGNQK